ncbi:hypothetical protein PYCC9005_004633 [Savitreella phatthalungensis]
MSNALLRFPSAAFAILAASASPSVTFSLATVLCRTATSCGSEGAGMRARRHRDRMGAMMREVVLATRMSLRLRAYFSIVLLSAACASLVSESASWITTTLNRRRTPLSTGALPATSFSKS